MTHHLKLPTQTKKCLFSKTQEAIQDIQASLASFSFCSASFWDFSKCFSLPSLWASWRPFQQNAGFEENANRDKDHAYGSKEGTYSPPLVKHGKRIPKKIIRKHPAKKRCGFLGVRTFFWPIAMVFQLQRNGRSFLLLEILFLLISSLAPGPFGEHMTLCSLWFLTAFLATFFREYLPSNGFCTPTCNPESLRRMVARR